MGGTVRMLVISLAASLFRAKVLVDAYGFSSAQVGLQQKVTKSKIKVVHNFNETLKVYIKSGIYYILHYKK